MREWHVSAFPVLDSADHVIGMLPEADLLLKQMGRKVRQGICWLPAPAGSARRRPG